MALWHGGGRQNGRGIGGDKLCVVSVCTCCGGVAAEMARNLVPILDLDHAELAEFASGSKLRW